MTVMIYFQTKWLLGVFLFPGWRIEYPTSLLLQIDWDFPIIKIFNALCPQFKLNVAVQVFSLMHVNRVYRLKISSRLQIKVKTSCLSAKWLETISYRKAFWVLFLIIYLLQDLKAGYQVFSTNPIYLRFPSKN